MKEYENWRYGTRQDETAREERLTESMINESNGIQTKRSGKRKQEKRQK